MIDFTNIRRSVEVYLSENFTMCPIAYENVPLPAPDPKELIAVYDDTLGTDQASMGSSAQITKGMLTIQIFTELGIGTERSRLIASELSNLLSYKTIGNAVFGETILLATYKTGYLVGDKADRNALNYFQQNLRLDYTADHGGSTITDC